MKSYLPPPSTKWNFSCPLGLGLVTLLAVACANGNSGSVAGSANASAGTDAKTSDSADSPNKPSPISGAYLVGVLKPTQADLCVGLLARGPNGLRLPASALADTSISYAPPAGAAPNNYDIKYYDLTKSPTGYFYNGVLCIDLRGFPSGAATSGLGLTGGAPTAAASARTKAISYFLKSTPLFSSKHVLLSSLAKTSPAPLALKPRAGSGLSLTGSQQLLAPTATTVGMYPLKSATLPTNFSATQSAGTSAFVNPPPGANASPDSVPTDVAPAVAPSVYLPPDTAVPPQVDPATIPDATVPVPDTTETFASGTDDPNYVDPEISADQVDAAVEQVPSDPAPVDETGLVDFIKKKPR